MPTTNSGPNGNGKGLTWPTPRMAKFIDVTPRRLQQLVQEGVVPKCEERGRYNPIAVNLAYIRFLRDRVQSPEASDSEFFAEKLAKLKAERLQLELQNQIIRKERIPIGDVKESVGRIFMAIRGIVKASFPVDRANEIFAEFRNACDWIRQKENEVQSESDDGRNGEIPGEN